MLCQNCKKKEAAFYYKQNVNGQISEVHLCADCARKYSSGNTVPDIFGIDLLGGFFGSIPVVRKRSKICPVCGSSFDDLVDSGKIGCAECYNTFRDELAGTVERIHGRVKHIGRGAAKAKPAAEADPEGENKEKELRERLAKAIADENYELAAQLRDEIKALAEGNNKNNETEGN
ncbi:MAG: UvrB/UvrC motif-containing protein [Clostridia bacterium]|nr:UvrB/UvrC motif-containing protein [Clostridia bacterium]